ncbi:lipocalin / cytosolic fatty-acid binding protein [Cooperia oncophora]
MKILVNSQRSRTVKMGIEEAILGKWTFVSSDNFEAYLKEANLKPTLEFVKEGDHIQMTSVSTFKTYVTKFKIGETFDEKTADGRDEEVQAVMASNRVDLGYPNLHRRERSPHSQRKSGKGRMQGTRVNLTVYVEGDKALAFVCECNGVKSTRIYERVKE